MAEPWFRARPALLQDVQGSLIEYPTLNLFVDGDWVEVRGTFPVIGVDGTAIDEFVIEMLFARDFPRSLPIVREVGGRIPPVMDKFHNPKGIACVLLPDARGECYPEGASFRQYLKVPLHNYFLGQSLIALGEPWPFEEWGHGDKGVVQFYSERFGTSDREAITRFLKVLSVPRYDVKRSCPCGSGKRFGACCHQKVANLRAVISTRLAYRRLGEFRKGS